MPQVRTWFPGEVVTLRNSWARLYFDPGRTRLMLDDGFVDFSNMRDRTQAMGWCQANGVDFFDHRPELLPEAIRARVRYARARGAGELRQLEAQWRLVPLGPVKMFMPQLSHLSSWRQARAWTRQLVRPHQDYPAPRYWNGTRYHAFSCACYDCVAARESEPAR